MPNVRSYHGCSGSLSAAQAKRKEKDERMRNARRRKAEEKEGYAGRTQAGRAQSDRQSQWRNRSRSPGGESPGRHGSRSRSRDRNVRRRSPRTNRPSVSSFPPEHRRTQEVVRVPYTFKDAICVPYSLCGVGRILGKGGVNMLRLQEETDTHIDVSKAKDSYEVLISGSSLESVERCKELVHDLVDEIREDRQCTQGDDSVEKEMFLSPVVVPRIIGRGGKKIKELQDESGASIDITNSANPPVLKIRGSSDCVAKASELISELIGDSFLAKDEFDTIMTETIEVSPEEVKRIIGKNGQSIMKLEEESGSKIDVVKPTGDPATLKLTGTSDAIARAIDLISTVIDTMAPEPPTRSTSDGKMTETIEVTQEQVKRILGRGGQSIMKLQEESGSKIDVVRPTGDPAQAHVVKLVGTSDAIAHAVEAISAIIDDMAAEPPKAGPKPPTVPKRNALAPGVRSNGRPAFCPVQWELEGSSASQAPLKPSSSRAPRPSQAPTLLTTDHEEDDWA